MLKKFMMICVYLMLGYQAKASTVDAVETIDLSISRSIASAATKVTPGTLKMKNICGFNNSQIGKFKVKASSYEEAFSKATDECFKRRNSEHLKVKQSHPDQDRQILYAETCVNNDIKCI